MSSNEALKLVSKSLHLFKEEAISQPLSRMAGVLPPPYYFPFSKYNEILNLLEQAIEKLSSST